MISFPPVSFGNGNKDHGQLKPTVNLSGLLASLSQNSSAKEDTVNLLRLCRPQPGRFIRQGTVLSSTAETRNKLDRPPPETPLVLMNEYAIRTFTGDASTRYIRSCGAGPCIMLTLYNPETKTGFLTHVPANPIELLLSTKQIKNALAESGNRISDYQARIIGGMSDVSEEGVSDVEAFLCKLGGSLEQIIEKDILGEKVRNIVLDLFDGEVYDYEESPSSDPETANRLAAKLKRTYEPLEQI